MKFGTPEIILILVIVIVIFGVGKLPQVASALGKSIRAFKDGQKDADAEEIEESDETKKKKKKKVQKADGEEPVDTTAEVVKNDPAEAEKKGPIVESDEE